MGFRGIRDIGFKCVLADLSLSVHGSATFRTELVHVAPPPFATASHGRSEVGKTASPNGWSTPFQSRQSAVSSSIHPSNLIILSRRNPSGKKWGMGNALRPWIEGELSSCSTIPPTCEPSTIPIRLWNTVAKRRFDHSCHRMETTQLLWGSGIIGTRDVLRMSYGIPILSTVQKTSILTGALVNGRDSNRMGCGEELLNGPIGQGHG
jgi:hypothetical protein